MNRAGIALLLTAPLLLAGCSSSPSTASAVDDGKFTQTWPQDYSDTTCTDWGSAMTEKQQFVAAADMLASARSKDGADTLPPDSLIDAFQGDVTEACSAGAAAGWALNEMGASLYLIGRDQYAP